MGIRPPAVQGTLPAEDASETFEAFYARLWPSIARLGIVTAGSADLGEDLAQEAFLRLRDHYARVEHPGAYLRKVLVNLAKSAATAESRRNARQLRAMSTEVHCLADAEDRELIEALKELSFKQRTALVLRYWGDWTDAAIADVLDCRAATVRSLIRRGLASLRSNMEDSR